MKTRFGAARKRLAHPPGTSMPIVPLPVFEADADPHHRSAMSDEEIYARLQTPKTIVIRFGYLKHVAEYPYDGDAKPGCGSKLVARTHRGTEVVEMLTTTCANSGCSKSVSRREMLDYIENSGGKEYPFHTKGRILRVATIDDLNRQSALESVRRDAIKRAKALIVELNLPMKLVEAEPILGGECLTFYYMSEQRVDFRELIQRLAGQLATRIEMRQVGARDEARITADYERCGQYCCCKNFLKVLKPVSMRQAKVQKATLDPLKISGRCGRLMCCLRYEDQTYKELKSRLPNRNKRVGTVEGPGVVVDTKILVQLALVRLEHDGREIAVPVEELMDPETCPRPKAPGAAEDGAGAGASAREGAGGAPRERDRRTPRDASAARTAPRSSPPAPAGASHNAAPVKIDDTLRGLSEADVLERSGAGSGESSAGEGAAEESKRAKRRRRRKRRGGRGGGNVAGNAGQAQSLDQSPQNRTPSEADRHSQQDAFRAVSQAWDDRAAADEGDPQDDAAGGFAGESAQQGSGAQPEGSRKRRRRRRRRRRGGGAGGNGGPGNAPPPPA